MRVRWRRLSRNTKRERPVVGRWRSVPPSFKASTAADNLLSRQSRTAWLRHHNWRMVWRTSATKGPLNRTAKSRRGCRKAVVSSWSKKSSNTLMPPQNATAPSTMHSLRCKRRQRLGTNRPKGATGSKVCHCTPACAKRCCHSTGTTGVPTPSTTTQVCTPRCAARSKAWATSAAVPWKSKI